MLFDRVPDHLLPGVGTHIFISGGIYHSGQVSGVFRHLFGIYTGFDIGAALAHKYAHSFSHPLTLLARNELMLSAFS
jgi:hypothetical protein